MQQVVRERQSQSEDDALMELEEKLLCFQAAVLKSLRVWRFMVTCCLAVWHPPEVIFRHARQTWRISVFSAFQFQLEVGGFPSLLGSVGETLPNIQVAIIVLAVFRVAVLLAFCCSFDTCSQINLSNLFQFHLEARSFL